MGKVTVTAFYAREGRRLQRVSRRTARVSGGRFTTELARFRRGRWRVRAVLKGAPSAVDARRLRLGGDPGSPRVRNDRRGALSGGREAPGAKPRGLEGEANFGTTIRPGPLAGGGYLGVRFAGSRGDVAFIQRALTAAGFATHADGVFGPETDTAVRRFQEARGLLVDGVVGRQTLAALKGD